MSDTLPNYLNLKQWHEKFKNLLLKRVCGICLRAKKSLISSDSIYIIENGFNIDQKLKDYVNTTFGFKVCQLLPTTYLCDECITIVLNANILLHKIKKNYIVLEQYCNVIIEHTNCNSQEAISNICININEEINNQEIKNEFDSNLVADQFSYNDGETNSNASENYLCSACDQRFEKLQLFMAHYKEFHSKEKIYKCIKCNKKFKVVQKLIKHRHIKHSEKLEYCSVCKVVLLVDSLKNHLKSHKKEFVCDLCNNVFNTKKDIKNHITQIHNKTDGTCERCFKSFKFKFQVKTHKCFFSCMECNGVCVHEKYMKSFREQYFLGLKEYKCTDCDYLYTKKSRLISHVNKEHLNILPFLCHLCGDKFASKETLLWHNHNKHKNAAFKCELCLKVFKVSSDLETHKIICATDRPFQCDMCSSRFESEEKYGFHRRKHFAKEIQCEYCIKKFWTKSDLKSHIRRLHSNKLDKSKIFQCTMCLLDFNTKKELLCHASTHPEDAKHICRLCNSSFKSKSNYVSHKRKHQYKRDRECPVCKKKYDRDTIGRHIKSHTKDEEADKLEEEKRTIRNAKKTVMCDVCGALLTNERSLSKHREIHKEQQQCPHCLKYVNAIHYNVHVNNHGRRRRKIFNCKDCSYTSNFMECLEGHVNRHHRQLRPYQCDICKKSFYAKVTLKEHIGTHLGLKPEQCEQCGKRFVNKKALKLHIRLHTGERPYPCDLCDEKFISASRRQMHRIRKHFEPSVQCPLCLKLYYTQATMKRHVQMCHSSEPRRKQKE